MSYHIITFGGQKKPALSIGLQNSRTINHVCALPILATCASKNEYSISLLYNSLKSYNINTFFTNIH